MIKPNKNEFKKLAVARATRQPPPETRWWVHPDPDGIPVKEKVVIKAWLPKSNSAMVRGAGMTESTLVSTSSLRSTPVEANRLVFTRCVYLLGRLKDALKDC